MLGYVVLGLGYEVLGIFCARVVVLGLGYEVLGIFYARVRDLCARVRGFGAKLHGQAAL